MNKIFVMKKTISLFLFLLMGFAVFSQEVILEQENIGEKVQTKNGPNAGYFTHSFIGLSFPVPPQQEGAALLYGKSWGMDFGSRGKYRFSNYYALGFDISYGFDIFRMKQEEAKVVPDKLIYDKQSLRSNEFRLGLFNRINFDKRRGNQLGRYIDLGAYGAYQWVKHKTEVEEDNSTYIAIHRKLEYIGPWQYGFFARLGSRRLLLTVDYRFSDFFSPDSGYPELPRFSVGLQFALF